MRIRAEQDATLTAAATAADNQAVDGAQPRGQIAIRGGSVSAGQDIRLQADGGVKLSGVTETDTRSDRGNRKNDGASLKPALGTMLPASSAWRKASCAPAVIWISAPAAISTPRRLLVAGRDASLDAGGALGLGVQQTTNQNSQRNDQVYWGGIGGGGNRDNGKTDTVNNGSDLTAGGKLTLRGDSVAIAGAAPAASGTRWRSAATATSASTAWSTNRKPVPISAAAPPSTSPRAAARAMPASSRRSMPS